MTRRRRMLADTKPVLRFQHRSRLKPARRRQRLQLDHLEQRALLAVTSFEATAFPKLLPPNNRVIPIQVTGTVSVDGVHRPDVNFTVTDEYRLVQPRGTVKPVLVEGTTNTYRFSFQIRLPAKVASVDTSGRQYYLTVAARHRNSSAGNTLPILVPNPQSFNPQMVKPRIRSFGRH